MILTGNLTANIKKISIHGHLSLNLINFHTVILPILFSTLNAQTTLYVPLLKNNNLNINFGKSNVSQITFVQQRGMFTIKWLEKFAHSSKYSIETKLISQPVRNYPGAFSGYKNISPYYWDGSEADMNHLHIKHNESDQFVAYCSSAKKGFDGTPNIRVDSVKWDGSFTRLRDPKTNEYLKDEQGNYILDPTSGGQRIGVYKYPRILNNTDKLVKFEESQPFFDRNEEKIEKIIQESNILNKRPEIK